MKKNHASALKALKISRGQIDGIIKMIEEERYCVDIANQLLATQALLRRSELLILQEHMRTCVQDACLSNRPEEKIEELNKILAKLITKA